MSVAVEVDPEVAGSVEALEDAAVEPLESGAAVLEQWAVGLSEEAGLQ